MLLRRRLLIGALAAVAASVVVDSAAIAETRIKVSVAGKTLKIRDVSTGSPANGDFDNWIDVKVKRDEGVAYVAEEYGPVEVGTGCTAGVFVENVSAGRPEDLWLPQWTTYDAVCQISGLKKVDVNSGPGSDYVEVLLSHVPVKIVGGAGDDDLQYFSLGDGSAPLPYFSTSNINGGLGDDYLVGGRGDDVVAGSRGYDWIEGTCGHDRLLGGSGDDSIVAQDEIWGDNDCPPTQDYVNCGDGNESALADPIDIVKSCD
jgi:Ca2+-binding RTX toxin-like protein